MRSTRARQSTAYVTSIVLAPAPVATLVLLATSLRNVSLGTESFPLLGASLACAVLLPMLCIEVGLRRGWLTRRDLPRREERPLPLAIAIVSVLVALALTQLGGADQTLRISLYAMASVLTIALCATLVSKISLHVAALAGAVIIVGHLIGLACLALVPLVLLVGWSRVELREHTPAQVGLGALIGLIGSVQAYIVGL